MSRAEVLEIFSNAGAVVFLLGTLGLCALAIQDAVRAWREGSGK